MSRGQQGIGISAAGMYGLITTGKPMLIQTRPSAHKPAHHIELAMNTKTNRAEVTVDEETDDFPLARLRDLTPGTRELAATGDFLSPKHYPTGTSVTVELEGRYQKGRGSVDEFLELTAIANPHARITFVPPSRVTADDVEEQDLSRRKDKAPDKASPESVQSDSAPPSQPQVTTETSGVIVFPRAINELPPETKEIMPHPKGIELGILLQMLKEAEQEDQGYTLYNFLQDKFSRVSAQSAGEFCKAVGLSSRAKIGDVDHATAEKLFKILQDSKLPPPPTDCLAPIGVRQLLKGMFKGGRAEFYAASSRQPEIYRGRPFLIEAAIAFGGELGPTGGNAEDSGSGGAEPARVIRFANRVPLLFQQSACSSFKAVGETNWRNYDLQQPRGGVPAGPIVIMIHMASVWVPFTSESKEAIADYDEIRKEMKLALMECGRKLGAYLRKRLKMKREAARRDIFERYIGEIAQAINAINGVETKKLYDTLLAQARKRTAIADLQLDDEGKKVKDEDPADQEGVIIVEAPAPDLTPSDRRNPATKGASDAGNPFVQSKREAAMLKVAAMDGDEPKLIDLDGPRRSGTKPKRTKSSTQDPRPEKSKPAPRQSSGKPSAQAAQQPATKPKLRLVNGKLVPVDEGPKLF